MGIRTKFNPMGGRSGDRYKAYLVYNDTTIDVATLGFTENIDPDKCFGTSFDAFCSLCCILNGKLYFFNKPDNNLILKDNTKNWTAFTGYNRMPNSGSYITGDLGLGIADGKLYLLDATANSSIQVGTASNFVKVSGVFRGQNTYCFAIDSDGLLFRISNTGTINQYGSSTSWTDVSGMLQSSSGTGYQWVGIQNGYIYRGGTSLLANASAISGYIEYSSSGSSTDIFALGISEGKLYKISYQSTTQVGTESAWTAISGAIGHSNYPSAMGIAEGKLYRVSSATNATQIGTSSTWTSVCGCVINSGNYSAYAINQNDLYRIDSTFTTTKLLSNCIKVQGCSGSSGTSASSLQGIALAICEA